MFVGPGHCGLRSNKCTTNTLSVSRLANKKLGQNLITFLHDPSRNANHALFAGLGEGVLKLIDFGFSKHFKEGKMMKSHKGKGCWELLEDAEMLQFFIGRLDSFYSSFCGSYFHLTTCTVFS